MGKRTWTEEEEKQLEELCNKNLTVREIAEIMDKNKGAIRHKVNRKGYNVKPDSKSHPHSHFIDDVKLLEKEEFDEFKDEESLVNYLYNEYYINKKMSLRKIGYIINKDASVLSNRFKKYGLKARNDRNKKLQYYCNEDYFQAIDTEDKAYWLGFLYADGYIAKACANGCSRRVGISLSESDHNHLEKFKENISSNVNISVYKSNGGYKEGAEYCRILLSSEKLVNDLIDKGCIEHKTDVIKFPTDNQVPKYLLKHFVRGYFDGDGSIKVRKTRYQTRNLNYAISFVGTDDLLNGIQNFLLEQGVIYKRHNLHKRKERQIVSCLDFGGNVQTLSFLEWLYEDSNVYLDRKYKRYLNLKEQMKNKEVA